MPEMLPVVNKPLIQYAVVEAPNQPFEINVTGRSKHSFGRPLTSTAGLGDLQIHPTPTKKATWSASSLIDGAPSTYTRR